MCEDDGTFEAMREYQYKYHELLGAMIRIKSLVLNDTISHTERMVCVQNIVLELDI